MGFAALASFNKAAIQSVQLPKLCLKYPWREKGPVVDSEKDSTVIQAAGAKDLPSVFNKKNKKNKPDLVSQEHEIHTDVADMVYCSAPVWMELF